MLTGSIPSELALVPTLDTIELRANNFTGSIPIEIASKAGLKVLSIASNQMSGTIHTEFGAPISSFRNLTQDQSNKHRRSLSTSILEILDIRKSFIYL